MGTSDHITPTTDHYTWQLCTMNLSSILLLCVLDLTVAATIPRSRCPPNPPTIKEFNATQYLGNWYEARRLPAFFELNTRCVRATYGVIEDQPGRVSVMNVDTKANGKLDQILGWAEVPDPEHPGELVSISQEVPREITGSWRLTTI